MFWVLIGWLAAVVIAVVVLGFCAYELVWKTKRLRSDLATLEQVGGRLQTVAGDLAHLGDRVSALRAEQAIERDEMTVGS